MRAGDVESAEVAPLTQALVDAEDAADAALDKVEASRPTFEAARSDLAAQKTIVAAQMNRTRDQALSHADEDRQVAITEATKAHSTVMGVAASTMASSFELCNTRRAAFLEHTKTGGENAKNLKSLLTTYKTCHSTYMQKMSEEALVRLAVGTTTSTTTTTTAAAQNKAVEGKAVEQTASSVTATTATTTTTAVRNPDLDAAAERGHGNAVADAAGKRTLFLETNECQKEEDALNTFLEEPATTFPRFAIRSKRNFRRDPDQSQQAKKAAKPFKETDFYKELKAADKRQAAMNLTKESVHQYAKQLDEANSYHPVKETADEEKRAVGEGVGGEAGHVLAFRRDPNQSQQAKKAAKPFKETDFYKELKAADKRQVAMNLTKNSVHQYAKQLDEEAATPFKETDFYKELKAADKRQAVSTGSECKKFNPPARMRAVANLDLFKNNCKSVAACAWSDDTKFCGAAPAPKATETAARFKAIDAAVVKVPTTANPATPNTEKLNVDLEDLASSAELGEEQAAALHKTCMRRANATASNLRRDADNAQINERTFASGVSGSGFATISYVVANTAD